MIDGSPRFLLVRLGSLGDVVHAIPAAAALRRRHPAARIDWAVDPRYIPLLECVASIDRAFAVDPRGPRRALLAAIGALRAVGYDAVVDLQGLVKSAVLTRTVRARRVIGFPRAHLREPMARAFYQEAPDIGAPAHVVHKNLALVRALDVDTSTEVGDAAVEFPLRVPSTLVVEEVHARWGGGAYALINPGAAWPNKRWPPDRFGALTQSLRERFRLPSLLVWGPGEEALASAVVAASAGAAHALPATTIVDLLGLARTSRIFVSGDTGPLHIAGAVGAPLVALFGPTRHERNGPWNAADITVSRFDRCSCPYERRCRLEARCIDDIPVSEVMAAVERRLAAHG